MTSLHLVSVNVGQVTEIGHLRNKPVLSGILKRPVETGSVIVTATGIVGDQQADLRAHGGPEKAVYCYALERVEAWNQYLLPDRPYGPATFGENLSLRGLVETEVCIGDIWQWGEVQLQVCQPRFPCYKLEMKLGRPGFIETFVESGWTGWYCRVLGEGEAPVGHSLRLVERFPDAPTVLEAHLARDPQADPDLLRRVAPATGLASGLHQKFTQRVADFDH